MHRKSSLPQGPAPEDITATAWTKSECGGAARPPAKTRAAEHRDPRWVGATGVREKQMLLVRKPLPRTPVAEASIIHLIRCFDN